MRLSRTKRKVIQLAVLPTFVLVLLAIVPLNALAARVMVDFVYSDGIPDFIITGTAFFDDSEPIASIAGLATFTTTLLDIELQGSGGFGPHVQTYTNDARFKVLLLSDSTLHSIFSEGSIDIVPGVYNADWNFSGVARSVIVRLNSSFSFRRDLGLLTTSATPVAAPIPLPGALALMGLALAGLGFQRRKAA